MKKLNLQNINDESRFVNNRRWFSSELLSKNKRLKNSNTEKVSKWSLCNDLYRKRETLINECFNGMKLNSISQNAFLDRELPFSSDISRRESAKFPDRSILFDQIKRFLNLRSPKNEPTKNQTKYAIQLRQESKNTFHEKEEKKFLRKLSQSYNKIKEKAKETDNILKNSENIPQIPKTKLEVSNLVFSGKNSFRNDYENMEDIRAAEILISLNKEKKGKPHHLPKKYIFNEF